jgi:hypothetical protein
VRLCIVGIGGCGGKMAEQFLRNQDVSILGWSLGEDLTFGEVKGIWLEAARMDAQKQRFFGPLDDGYYPGYYITHEIIKDGSDLSKLVADRYGYDLKSPGFFRAADYLKAIFEIFDMDEGLQKVANREYHDKNPILSNIWRRIRPYTIVSEGAVSPERMADRGRMKPIKVAEITKGTRGTTTRSCAIVSSSPSLSEGAREPVSSTRLPGTYEGRGPDFPSSFWAYLRRRAPTSI